MSNLEEPKAPARGRSGLTKRLRPLAGAALLVGLGGCFLSGDKKRSTIDDPLGERDEAAVTPQSCADVDPNLGVPADLPPSSTVAAGKIADQFQVSPNGAAVYSVPISVPPGRAGLEPSLALSYSSDAPNGIAGVGFGLQGLSIITRCPLNVAEDGRYREVSYDAEDRFCLDGQRLVAVEGAYGAEGTEYRTRPDTFTKVVSRTTAPETGPYKFTVYTKDGRILTYGDDDDPFHGGPASRANVVGTSTVRAWALRRVEDRLGNYMLISYVNRTSQGDGVGYTVEQLPQMISYTGHGTSVPTRFVVLRYGDRPDVWSGYTKGMRVESTKRLEDVTTYLDLEPVRSYHLTYGVSQASGRSRVERVEECAADGVCKPPTVFRWKDMSAGEPFYGVLPGPSQPLPDPPQPDATYVALDMNGDGLDDIALPRIFDIGSPFEEHQWVGALADVRGARFGAPYLAFEELGQGAGQTRPMQGTPIDYNQDGKDDLLLHDPRAPFWRVLVSQNVDDSTATAAFSQVEVPGIPSAIRVISGQDRGSFHLADMTGDGVTDLIQCEVVGGGFPNVWRLYPHDGSTFLASAAEIITPLTSTSTAPVRPSAPCDQKILSFDIDGDGALELLVKQTATVISLENYKIISRKKTAISAAQWVVSDSSLPLKAKTLFPMDVNGDGLKDVVALGQVSEVPGIPDDARFRTYFNIGAGFGPEQFTFGDGRLPDYNPLFDELSLVVDANGDGRQDLLVPHAIYNNNKTWHLLLSDGQSLQRVDSGIVFEYRLGGLSPGEPGWTGESWRYQGPRANRSGGIYAISQGHFLEYASRAENADVIDAIMDGLSPGVNYETFEAPKNLFIYYDNLESRKGVASTGGSRQGPYLKGDTCAYPVSCVASSKRVVASYYMPKAGFDVDTVHNVYYRDARYDRLARRWLGVGVAPTRLPLRPARPARQA